MAKDKTLLADEQWQKIESLLPKFKRSAKGGPKPVDNRKVFEGILWVLRSGARWKYLPKQYSSASTGWRRLCDWEEEGVWERVWRSFVAELDDKGQLDWAETFPDDSFAPAKKRGACVGKTKRGKGTKWMWWTAKVCLSETTWTRRPRRK